MLGLPGGRGWTSVPRGHRARGEVPTLLKTQRLGQDAPQILAQGPARPPGCSSTHSYPPGLPVSSGSSRALCPPSLSVLITALA